MKKRRSKTMGIFLLIIFLLSIPMLIVGFVGSYSIVTDNAQSFSIGDGDIVYIPQYSNIECGKTDRPTKDLYYYPYGEGDSPNVDIEDENGVLYKTLKGLEIICSGGVDSVYTNECNIYVKRTDSKVTSNEYLCDINEYNTNNCDKITVSGGLNTLIFLGKISTNQKIIVEDLKESFSGIGFGTEVEKGDIIYIQQRDEYGLISRSNGMIAKYNSCDLRDIYSISAKTDILPSIFNEAISDKKIIGTELMFGEYVNYITGYVSIVDSNNVIQNGKYYTTGNSLKYYIVEAKSGRKYVDMTNPIRDDNIICNPSEIWCINDGRVIDEQFGINDECDESKPVFGFFPYTEKDNWVAERVCKNGEWIETNAKAIPECTAEKPILNSNYECVKGTIQNEGNSKDDEGEDYTLIYVLLAGIVGVGISSSGALEKLRGGNN